MIANMRYLTSALAILLAAALMGLVRYAAGADGYYLSGISRWEHADRWGKTPFLVASVAISGATVIGLLVSTVSRNTLLRRLVLPATALSCAMLLMAWFFLTAGH
jgi:hypothetical protein